jgi:hypothetical protein
MIYCKKCGFSLVEFEIEELTKSNEEPLCWECKRHVIPNYLKNEE